MSIARKIDFLRRLPHEQFLLHGSVHKCEVLEPHLAPGYSQYQCLCAVYATPIIEVALLKATFDGPPHSWGWRLNWGAWSWRKTPKLELHILDLDQVTAGPGYIYLLERKKFMLLPGLNFVALEPVIPLATVEVDIDWYDHFKISFKGSRNSDSPPL